MIKKKIIGLVLIAFAVVVVAVILSIDTNATPDKNGDTAGCGDTGCHEHIENDEEDALHLHVDNFTSEQEISVNIIFWTDNTGERRKLEYQWNESEKEWEPISVAAELTDARSPSSATVFDTETCDGPMITLNAPDGGRWWIYAGYYNKTEEECYYTRIEVDIDYGNHQPVAKIVWDGYDKGLAIKNNGEVNKNINGTTNDALFKFDDEGQVSVYFLADCSDPDSADEDNLSYYWDFNNYVDANDDEDKTNDNDTCSQGQERRVNFYFYQANHPNNWENKRDPEEIFEPNKDYTINFAVTDSHLHNAWDWSTLNIRFQESKEYPDLEVYKTTFSTIDKNKDGNYSIGEPMAINVTIRNIGEDSTHGKSFNLRFEDQDSKKIFPHYEYTKTLEADGEDIITFEWTNTDVWADGVTKPKNNIDYDISIIIDSDNEIDEGSTGGEDNNEKIFKGAFKFTLPPEDNSIELEIEKITINGTALSGVYEILQEYPITINITVKNKGLGHAEVCKVIIFLAKTDTINIKEKKATIEITDLEPGKSITLSEDYLVFLTSADTIDNQVLEIVIEYEEEEVDSKEIKLLVKSKFYNKETPIINFTFLSNNATIYKITKIYKIEGTLTDDIKVIKVQIKIDDSEWQDAEGTTEWTYDWDLTNVKEGKHTISVRVFYGNAYSKVEKIEVNIEKEKKKKKKRKVMMVLR